MGKKGKQKQSCWCHLRSWRLRGWLLSPKCEYFALSWERSPIPRILNMRIKAPNPSCASGASCRLETENWVRRPHLVPSPGPWPEPHSLDVGWRPPTGLNPIPSSDELGDLGKGSQPSHPSNGNNKRWGQHGSARLELVAPFSLLSPSS